MTGKRPNSCTNLNKALLRLAGSDESFLDIRATLANVIVGQLLPDCVVKGGSQLKLRFGPLASRVTMDLDTARSIELDAFIKRFRAALAKGWNDFTADLIVKAQASPKGIPFEYVMQPLDVKLRYRGQPWYTILVEVGHNEIGDAEEADRIPLPSEIVQTFDKLGFPDPEPIPLMPLKYQVAQKLHGLTAKDSDRVRDVIDLQLIARAGIDLSAVRPICEQLFAYRKCQPWPPKVEKGKDWDSLYNAARGALPVCPTVDEAIDWANDFITKIDKAEDRGFDHA